MNRGNGVRQCTGNEVITKCLVKWSCPLCQRPKQNRVKMRLMPKLRPSKCGLETKTDLEYYNATITNVLVRVQCNERGVKYMTKPQRGYEAGRREELSSLCCLATELSQAFPWLPNTPCKQMNDLQGKKGVRTHQECLYSVV